MTQAVLFDVDGTLLDPVDLHARAWHEAFAKFGIKTSYDDVRSQIGKGGDQLMPVFVAEDRHAVIGGELEKYQNQSDNKYWVRSLFCAALRPKLNAVS